MKSTVKSRTEEEVNLFYMSLVDLRSNRLQVYQESVGYEEKAFTEEGNKALK